MLRELKKNMQKNGMKLAAALTLVGATFADPAAAQEATTDANYQGSLYSEVWQQVSSDLYLERPYYEVTFGSFFDGLKNLILENSERTLEDQRDILPYFNKLVHPNGICMKGRWVITEDNPFTGAFRPGTDNLIIARASTALTNVEAGTTRAFGFAGKIYPTNDPNHLDPLKTANFFTIEDLGGRKKDAFLDAVNTNDIIKISPTYTAFMNSLVGLAVANAFPKAEDSNLQTALIRELYPLSELGEANPENAKTPTWLKIEGADDVERVYRKDFRDELNIANYPDGLRFTISVADEGSRFGSKEWQAIGYIEINDTVVSESCDHRLHFTHPPARKIY
jgi:hypothetical protein